MAFDKNGHNLCCDIGLTSLEKSFNKPPLYGIDKNLSSKALRERLWSGICSWNKGLEVDEDIELSLLAQPKLGLDQPPQISSTIGRSIRGNISRTSDSQHSASRAREAMDESSINVLIVDDDRDNLLFAQYAIESFGYIATTLTSAHHAVSTALNCLPDVILLDILLDGVSGIELLYRLRKHEQLSHIPIIAVTALAHPAEKSKLMSIGFSDYLSKPYMLDELKAMLHYHLR